MSSSGEADQPAADADKPKAKAEPKHWLEYAIFAFVIATAIATSLAAYYTRQQWLTAADTERRQLRAYVSAGVEQYPDINAEHLEYTVLMKNHGQTPAFKMRGWSTIFISDFYPLPEDVVKLHETEMENVRDEDVLFPGGERRNATVEGMGTDDRSHDPTPEQRIGVQLGFKSLWIFGKVTYVDAFGVAHYTRFRLFQSGKYMVRMKKLFWATEGNCTDENCPK